MKFRSNEIIDVVIILFFTLIHCWKWLILLYGGENLLQNRGLSILFWVLLTKCGPYKIDAAGLKTPD